MCIKTKCDRTEVLSILSAVVVAGIHFIEVQTFEYIRSVISYRDSIYGCTFYSITGLHLTHVVIGIILLLICIFRISIDPHITQHGLSVNIDMTADSLYELTGSLYFFRTTLERSPSKHRAAYFMYHQSYAYITSREGKIRIIIILFI